MRKDTINSILKDLTRKNNFFERLSWSKFNNLGLGLGLQTLHQCGKKIKSKTSTFVENTEEKLEQRTFVLPIMNRVN